MKKAESDIYQVNANFFSLKTMQVIFVNISNKKYKRENKSFCQLLFCECEMTLVFILTSLGFFFLMYSPSTCFLLTAFMVCEDQVNL